MTKFIIDYWPSIRMTLEGEAESEEEALEKMHVGVVLAWEAPKSGEDCDGYGNGDVELLSYRLYDPEYHLQ